MSGKLRQLGVLLRKDLLLFTQRAQYRLYVALLTIFVVYSVIAGVQRYRIAVAGYQHWSELQQQTVQQIRYANSLQGPGYTQRFPPAVMSVFAQGADDLITVPFVTRSWTKQQIGYFTPDGSVTRLIPSIDFLVLVLLLGGLFTVWLCHDFVLQEISNRTIITNVLFNVSERMFVISKFLAMLIGAVLPTLILFLLSASLVPLFCGTGDDYLQRSVAFASVLVVYQTFWVGIALLVQSLGISQRTALIYGIGAWVALAFLIPNLSLLVQTDSRVEAVNRFMERKTTLSRVVEGNFRAYRREESPPARGLFELFDYQAKVERAMLDDGAYDRLLEATSKPTMGRVESFSVSAISPYTAAAVAATELANTGVGTYVATRADMLAYHRHYHAIEASPAIWRWGHQPETGIPIETIKKLDVAHRRPPLTHNLKDAKVPLLGLLFDVLLLVPLSILLMERRIGGKRSRRTA